jgi:hypothetical protein
MVGSRGTMGLGLGLGCDVLDTSLWIGCKTCRVWYRVLLPVG